MSFDSDEESIIEEDYYACLNISKEATPEEITSAYRRLSRLYHPDKHTDAEQKVKADLLFNKIKRAYEILSDPHQRAIYDTVGLKGLKTNGWAIVPRTKTPQEIRDEYERLAREQNERRLQQRTNPRGNVIININATDLFTTYDDEYDEFLEKSYLPNIEISGMSMSQAIEAPLTLRDTLTLQGHLAAQNGTGSGSFIVSGKRLISPNGWIEAEFSAGSGPMAALKLSRSLTSSIFGNFATQLKFTSSGPRLGLVSSLGMPLDRYTQGYLTWNVGFASSMTTLIVRETDTSHSSVAFSLGLTSSFMSASQTWKINKADLKLRIYCKLGTMSSSVECSAEKKVSEQSILCAAVSVGVPSGVTLKIKINRARQSYIFPIQLSEDPRLLPSVYAVITPLVVYFTVKKLIVEPFIKGQKEKKIEKQREVNKNRMEEKKREAKAAVDLMKATYERIHAEEEGRNGLLILRALYGKDADVVAKNDAPSSSQLCEVIDVTVPVQCLVKNSQLVIHNTSKSQLSGFYDPCVGEEKVLYVKYSFHSHVCETTVADPDGLRIPKQSHRVNTS